MQERAIHISSVNRQKIGRSRPEDFIIKFDPPLKLDTTMRHELAVDRVSMTYSWHNVNAGYNNNTIKYSADNGTNGRQSHLLMECIHMMILMIISLNQ